MLLTVVALMINSYFVLGVMRQQVVLQRHGVEMQAEYTEAVKTLAHWQGPLSLTTHAELDGHPIALGLQEARGPRDVENVVERQVDSLTRMAEHK